MTETRRPDPCHYDRTLGHRVTRAHRDDCPRGNDCPGQRGCAPCTAPHCAVCGTEHADNAHPQTCAKCQGKIAGDLRDIRTDYALLGREALEAGADGHLVAAAPIPGGTAAVLIGPTVRMPLLRFSRTWRDDHPVSKKTGKPTDPIPPLAILAQWEDIYRAHLGHDTPAKPTDHARWGQLVTGPRRATIGGAIAYLLDQLPHIAQDTSGPDFLEFTRQIRTLRAACERALHDEREPETGVECFECGDKLVRRLRRPAKCTHPTPARTYVRHVVDVLGYPEHLTHLELRALRTPCGECSQGGIDDPSAGQSWECPGCRKEYDPGEYATAVRRDLLDNGVEGDGWTHVTMAAEAATTLVGLLVPPATVRKWMDRGKVTSCCLWRPGVPWGVRLVFWPDVADEAVAAVARHHRAAEARRRKSEREEQERQEEAANDAARVAS